MTSTTVRACCLVALLASTGCFGPKVTTPAPASLPPTDSSDTTIAHGRDLFAAKCNHCHSYADPSALDETKWPETIERMGRKADLAQADRDAVLRYILAAKKAETSQR